MSQIRSFIAIDLPDKAKEQIGKFQQTLQTPDSLIRWELPENFHQNLYFLGNQRDENLQRLGRRLSRSLTTLAFTLQPTNLEYLYKKHEDSIVYIALQGDLDQLIALYEEVAEAVRDITKLIAPSRFLPHITIGRLKPNTNPVDKKKILFDLMSHQPKKLSPIKVGQIKIFQTSFLTDRTHRYLTLHTIDLSSP